MADFDYVQTFVYDVATGALNTSASNSNDGTVTDTDNDDQFEVGDTFVEGNNGTLYVGTVQIDGTEMPVFEVVQTGSPQNYIVLNPGPDEVASPPSTFPTLATGQTFAFCFLAGTMIATPEGERAVETLSIGDPILTANGRSVPVRWMGRQTSFPMFAGPACCRS